MSFSNCGAVFKGDSLMTAEQARLVSDMARHTGQNRSFPPVVPNSTAISQTGSPIWPVSIPRNATQAAPPPQADQLRAVSPATIRVQP